MCKLQLSILYQQKLVIKQRIDPVKCFRSVMMGLAVKEKESEDENVKPKENGTSMTQSIALEEIDETKRK